MAVLSDREIQFVRGSPFSQAFTCSLADIIGPGYPPSDIETFATSGGTFSVSVARRGENAFADAGNSTATISGDVITLSMTAVQTARVRNRAGYFTVDVSNGIERWRVIDGTWTASDSAFLPAP